ncbi:MAG TPA: 6-pyruvoyl-tetrahydropterin synthase-related protein [Anaerolineae bacterium]|nr:6-pyruvoyl-tetrahydropterin synthase-related protein [Anaerolineae bacterium]HOR00300.1 6-pyruvoyl-tetrahydropterin synthase-related protein [Anaerolineae bacterium]HPL27053.1 6-pyruvoyl-tetrahydropterin synthase-related protein [Anaerolineae bacterium]
MSGLLRRAGQVVQALMGPLAAAALYAVAALPLATATLTRSDDGLIHLYRLLEFDRCLAQGSLLPRWAPDLAQGYGYPLFSFYPPLAYHVAEVWHLLGLSLVRALNLTFVLSGMLSGASMYLLVRDWAGPKGALLAAMLYMYAPFALYSAYYRGGVAEVLAWALAPLALWAFRKLVRSGDARWLLPATLAYAAIPLSHFLAALMLTPLLVLTILGTWWARRSRRGLALAALALALALGISAFSTVPALLEQGSVRLDLASSGYFDFRLHFSTWQSLLAGPTRVDVSLPDRAASLSAGWIQAGAALLGLFAMARHSARSRMWGLGMAAIALALALLMQRVTLPIWEALPVLSYLQFPWRLLFPLALLLAVVGGAVGLVLPDRGRWAWAATALVAVVALGLFVYNTPLFYPGRARLRSANPNLADLQQYEHDSSALGLTTNGEYLPAGVQQMPPQPRELEGNPGAAAWVDRQSLPADVAVGDVSYHLNDIEFVATAQAPFSATINQFYFPGWQAYVDGAPVQVSSLPLHGLIGVNVPAGAHRVRLRFEDTLLRRSCSVASLISLLVLSGMAVLSWRRGRAAPGAGVSAKGDGRLGSFPAWGWLLLLGAVAGYVAFKGVVLDRYDSFLKVQRLDGNTLKAVGSPLQAKFGDELELLGYDLPPGSTAPGEAIELTLYWKALRQTAVDYSASLQLVDGQGRLWGQEDHWHIAGFPTSDWSVDEYRPDAYRLAVPPGTPPGDYRLRVGVYGQATGQALQVLEGAPAGTSVALGTAAIVRPWQPPGVAALGMQQTVATALNDDLELLGYSIAPGQAGPGRRVHLDLFWRARSSPQADYQVETRLAGEAGYSARQTWPLVQGYPTMAWQAGEVIHGQYDLLLPADVPPGRVALYVTLDGPAAVVPIGELDIAAIARRMDVPPMGETVGGELGDAITLLGYDLDRREVRPGETVHLTLYWQARQRMQQEYTVFTHLLDATGRIVAQQDSAPAQGARPTTSWLEGEVIVDEYALTVQSDAAAGEHQIEVGLYEPDSGRRLAVIGSDRQAQGDHVLLGTIGVR